ncbi:unnamed protein product [Sphagnum jensenii]|uniref:Uncharacterized protein n=1 Tax=Sphagnum jensenii TaxID=128206 RepID=A0ABP1BHL6_9BRYO
MQQQHPTGEAEEDTDTKQPGAQREFLPDDVSALFSLRKSGGGAADMDTAIQGEESFLPKEQQHHPGAEYGERTSGVPGG